MNEQMERAALKAAADLITYVPEMTTRQMAHLLGLVKGIELTLNKDKREGE